MTYSLQTLSQGSAPAGTRPGAARFSQEVVLVLGAAALLFWLLAMASYSAQDPAITDCP